MESFLRNMTVFSAMIFPYGFLQAEPHQSMIDRSSITIAAATPVVTNDWFTYGTKTGARNLTDGDPGTSYRPAQVFDNTFFFRLESESPVSVGGVQLWQTTGQNALIETFLKRTVQRLNSQTDEMENVIDSNTANCFARVKDGTPALSVFDASDTASLEFIGKQIAGRSTWGIDLQEIKFYPAIPFEKLQKIQGVGVVDATPHYGTCIPENALDGNDRTEYVSNLDVSPALSFITFKLGETPVPVCGIRVKQRDRAPFISNAEVSFSESGFPKVVNVQQGPDAYLPDDVQKDLMIYCKPGNKQTHVETIVTFPPRQARFIRFRPYTLYAFHKFPGIAEIEFYTCKPGEDINALSAPLPPETFRVVDGTLSAESLESDGHLDKTRGSANLLDGNPETVYRPIDGVEAEIEFDFQKPETVSGISILQDPEISHATRGMLLFPESGSNQSQPEKILTGPFINGRSFTVFPAKNKRFMHLHFLGYSGKPQTAIQEIEFYSPLPSYRLKKIDNDEIEILDSAPSFPGEYGVEKAIDGDMNSDYASDNRAENTFIKFKFKNPKMICGFRHFQRKDSAQITESKLDFEPQEGVDEKTTVSIKMNAKTNNPAETFVSFPPQKATSVLWKVELILDSYRCVGAREIEFYEWKPTSCILILD